jgi:serine/threonine-protein kinase
MKRQVAVKVLPRQFTFDPQFRSRFQREAEVIAALEHPFIVPVYDFGEHEEQPFIVMRYMPEGTLADRLKKGALPIPEVSAVLERVGSALDYAHSKGVIHCDVKPGISCSIRAAAPSFRTSALPSSPKMQRPTPGR